VAWNSGLVAPSSSIMQQNNAKKNGSSLKLEAVIMLFMYNKWIAHVFIIIDSIASVSS
jgi:hypothetical protein